METAEQILDSYIHEHNEYLDSDQKSVVVDAMMFYANYKLDKASNLAYASSYSPDTPSQIFEKIVSLKDAV